MTEIVDDINLVLTEIYQKVLNKENIAAIAKKRSQYKKKKTQKESNARKEKGKTLT